MNTTKAWLGMSTLLVAEAMNLLDSTITTVAAPVIDADFHGSLSSTQWIAATYSLAFAIVLIPGGRLGDIFGRRKIFLIGLLAFLLMSAACAAAPNLIALLGARVVQGAAAEFFKSWAAIVKNRKLSTN